MHLENIRGSEVLVLDSKLDVMAANHLYTLYTLLGLDGVDPPEDYDASSSNWPFTDGGEFPKALGSEDTTICTEAMSNVIHEPLDVVKENLRQAAPRSLGETNMPAVTELVAEAYMALALWK